MKYFLKHITKGLIMRTIAILVVLLVSTVGQATTKSICGFDDREFSNYEAVGRVEASLEKVGGCSAALIGRSCAITAGGCVKILKYVEFNPALPGVNGVDSRSLPEDIYKVDQSSIVSEFKINKDWAVFKLQPNSITKKLPGDVIEPLSMATKKPLWGAAIYLPSYGYDVPARRYTQQTSHGRIKRTVLAGPYADRVYHLADSAVGSTGAPIILTSNNKIIGIHTNAGCGASYGPKANYGTMILKNRKFRQAIQNCLASEE
jgi:V8-like Glu-specific endopeptidase